MPHREISFLDGKVTAKKVGQAEYHGQEMSDGERVILYFIGQCLSLPEHSVIIIDEPEMHLHKSLVDKLWNRIESQIQNKLIIYITHDLEFASSRTDAMKFWVKEYNGSDIWIWEEIPTDEALPESLMLEIIPKYRIIVIAVAFLFSFSVSLSAETKIEKIDKDAILKTGETWMENYENF